MLKRIFLYKFFGKNKVILRQQHFSEKLQQEAVFNETQKPESAA